MTRKKDNIEILFWKTYSHHMSIFNVSYAETLNTFTIKLSQFCNKFTQIVRRSRKKTKFNSLNIEEASRGCYWQIQPHALALKLILQTYITILKHMCIIISIYCPNAKPIQVPHTNFNRLQTRSHECKLVHKLLQDQILNL